MSLLRLNVTHYNRDLTCPHCQAALAAEWSTEYGDPMPGDHSTRCPSCSKPITVDVEVTTTYSPRRP